MITCRMFVEFLMNYLEGDMPAEERNRFDAHLAVCEACVDYMKSYQETVRLGKEAFRDLDAEVPPDVPEDLVKAILSARRDKE